MNTVVMDNPNLQTPKNPLSTILIVDDDPGNLSVLGEALQPQYRIRVATSGPDALRVAASEPRPDMILLDIMMPEMDGYAVLNRLRESELTRDIPVMFVTALGETEDEELGLRLGAVDYISKPIKPAIVKARVNTHLQLKRAQDALRDRNACLESEVTRRIRENQLIEDIGLLALASMAETRDADMSNHILRTQAYVAILGRELKTHPRFAAHLTEPRLQLMVKAVALHDIGKVGLPEHILRKKGWLTLEESEIMRTHSLAGYEGLDLAMRRILNQRGNRQPLAVGEVSVDESNESLSGALAFLEVAKELVRSHHEKWDGSGYPDGLAGEVIPVSARLMALADAFDALAGRRNYKEPLPMEQVTAIIQEAKGRHFDPDVVDAYLDVRDQFERVAVRYADGDQAS